LNLDGNVVLTFSISHPFEKGIIGDPPTGKNRLDLDVFDLALVIAPQETTAINYSLIGLSVYNNICGEADGYTTELDEMLQDSAAMPYFLVIDDSIGGSGTYNKFEMGTKGVEFDTVFDLSSGVLRFDLYLTMGYGFSAVKADRLNPAYYNPEFNRKASWKIVVTPPEGDDPPAIGNTWDNADSLTLYNVTVEVYDWQIGANVDPDLTNPDDIYAASGVSSVSVEIPGMNNTLQSITDDDGTGTGMPDAPLIFNVPFANENLLATGEYIGLVKVTDERSVGTISDRDFLIDCSDGITLNYLNLPEFATYQTFVATVVYGCGPITGSITDPVCPLSGVGNGAYITFTADASSANGGDPITLYEWDHDYDGIIFDAEFTGVSASIGPFNNPNCPEPTPVTYTVAVQATDSCDHPNQTIFATCEVTVDQCCTNLELLYDFVGCESLTLSCQGWTAGGCDLPNDDLWGWGQFAWGCDVGSPCGLTYPYVITGGDVGSCGSMDDQGREADYNLVSPIINLPVSANSTLEWDHCNAFPEPWPLGGDPSFNVYISENGCDGPWIELWGTTEANGCFNDSNVDISDYSGDNIMFRFRYNCMPYSFDGGSCGNAGLIIDNIRIFGCFNGDLYD